MDRDAKAAPLDSWGAIGWLAPLQGALTMNAVAATADADIRCPYCEELAVLLGDSSRIYGGRNFGPIWICEPCGAWVGTHKGTTRPLGRLANLELRRAKMGVHSVFDHLWRDVLSAYPDADHPTGRMKHVARARAYAWLAEQLGIQKEECHVGMFDLARCKRAVEVIERLKPTPGIVRQWAKNRLAGSSL